MAGLLAHLLHCRGQGIVVALAMPLPLCPEDDPKSGTIRQFISGKRLRQGAA